LEVDTNHLDSGPLYLFAIAWTDSRLSTFPVASFDVAADEKRRGLGVPCLNLAGTRLTMRAKYIALDRRRQVQRRQAAVTSLDSVSIGNGTTREHRSFEFPLAQLTENSMEGLLEQRERREELAHALDALPALDRAQKLQRRAARTGFDWPNSSGARAKIDEELEELDRETSQERRAEELGDLLFAVVNLSRHLKVDPEEALRQANQKFERRFREIEKAPGFEALSLDDKEDLWRKAKAAQSD